VRAPDRGVIRVTRSGLPQFGHAGCSLPPTSRIKSRMANMLHLRSLGRGLLQRNAIACRRSVAAIGLESKKPLSGIASCALTTLRSADVHREGAASFPARLGWPDTAGLLPSTPIGCSRTASPQHSPASRRSATELLQAYPMALPFLRVSNDRLKFKRLFKSSASQKQGVFVDLISLLEALALQAAEC
jgi:hypothetical protein